MSGSRLMFVPGVKYFTRNLQNPFLCRHCSTLQSETKSFHHSQSSDPHLDSESQPPSNSTKELRVKHMILDRSLLHVQKHGWSEKSIIAGAKECGYSSSSHGLFPRGGADLALYFYQTSNQQLVDKLTTEISEQEREHEQNELKPSRKPVGKFIRDAMESRIRMTAAHQSNWPEAMALMTHPNAACDALSMLSQLVDDVWYLAGDKSHDMNWYTKRASLAFIYKTSELFMLQDKSEDLEETWRFLDRRFEDVGVVGSTLSTTSDLAQGFVNGGFKTLWTVAKNMAGVYPR